MSNAEIDACAKRLLDEHFSRTHTDMVGDEEERRGYRRGISDLATALKAISRKPS